MRKARAFSRSSRSSPDAPRMASWCSPRRSGSWRPRRSRARAPGLWFVALPLLCVGSFGVWGIAERTAAERTARLGPGFGGRRALASVRVTAAVVGTLSGLLTLLVVVARMVGTWNRESVFSRSLLVSS